MEIGRRHFLVGGVAALAVGLGSAAGAVSQETETGTETETTTESYPIEDATSLRVNNGNGDVSIRTHGEATVDVTITKSSSAGQEAFDRTHVRQRIEDETFVLETEYENGETALVDYEIRIPESLAVEEVGTVNGDVSVEGTTGDLLASVTNGTVDVADVDGFVTLETTNGDVVASRVVGIDGIGVVNGSIDAEVASIRQDVGVRASTGDIAVHVGPDLDADLSATAGIGGVSLADDVPLADDDVSEQQVIGRVGDGGDRLDVSTDIGTVTIDSAA